jgi:hypothetical protein
VERQGHLKLQLVAVEQEVLELLSQAERKYF